MKQSSPLPSTTQQLVQFGILIATLGVVLSLIGLYPGVTGVEPQSGIGVLQIIIILFGMSLIIGGALIFVKIGFYRTIGSNLAQRIAVRLSFTGLLFAAAAGLSDVLGYGSNPPAGDDVPILGTYQVMGMVIGFLVAVIGILVFLIAGPVYKIDPVAASEKRKTMQNLKRITQPLEVVLDIVIRETRVEDAEAFLALQKQLDIETQFMLLEPDERTLTVEDTYQRLKTVGEDNHQQLLVAVEGEKLVGYVSAVGGEYKRVYHSAHVVIGVLEAYRGRGIGTLLFEKLEKWAKTEKIHRLELTVMSHNEVGIGLYQKMGFQVEGTKRDSMKVEGKYIDELYMAKLIEI